MKALIVENVRKTYSNGVQALKEVSFSIEQGDYFALLGPNGAGKTTLIGILTSLVKKTAGKISIYGYDIDTNFEKAKACIGVVPQEINLSVFDKVESILIDQAGYFGIPHKIAKQRAEYYLKRLDLWEKRHSIPRFLSGGMKRRLMIARAMMSEPKLLILDEPTAGVDVELRHSMWRFLNEINQNGVTIVLTTHYLEEAENQCRNVAIIDRGEIVEYTSMATLLEKMDYEHLILNLTERYTELPSIPNVIIHPIDSMTLEIQFPKEMALSALFSLLHEKGIAVSNVRNKMSRLEFLFLALTKGAPNSTSEQEENF